MPQTHCVALVGPWAWDRQARALKGTLALGWPRPGGACRSPDKGRPHCCDSSSWPPSCRQTFALLTPQFLPVITLPTGGKRGSLPRSQELKEADGCVPAPVWLPDSTFLVRLPRGLPTCRPDSLVTAACSHQEELDAYRPAAHPQVGCRVEAPGGPGPGGVCKAQPTPNTDLSRAFHPFSCPPHSPSFKRLSCNYFPRS